MSFTFLPEEAPEQPETTFGEKVKEAVRPVGRTATAVAGGVVGLPGDIARLLNDYIAGPISEKITGQKALPYEETHIGKLLPTSEQATRALRSPAPEYLSPRGENEQLMDDIVTDTALLFAPTKVPFGRTARHAPRLLKSFATSLGSNVLGKAVEDFSGGDKEKGAYTKLGSMFLLSLLDKKKGAQLASELYGEAQKALPAGAKGDAQKLAKSLTNLRGKMLQGTLAPSEKFIADEAKAVLKKIHHGEIPIEEAWAAKRSLNEKLQTFLYESPEKAAKARARKLSSEIQHGLSDVLDEYGKRNKTFGKAFQGAEEAFGAIAGSNFFSRAVNKLTKYKPDTPGLMALFGHGAGSALMGAGTSALGGATPAALAGAAAYPVAKLGYRLVRSPVLRRHYLETVKAAGAENAQVFNRELEKLDKAFKEDMKKDKYSFVD